MKTLKRKSAVLLVALTLTTVLLLCSGCSGLFDRHETVSPTGQTNTTYTVKTGVTNGLDKAREVAGQVPAPFGLIATSILGITGTVLSLIAKAKSDNKAALLPAVITGVENAASNDTVKRSIEQVARATGQYDRLHAEVQKITK